LKGRKRTKSEKEGKRKMRMEDYMVVAGVLILVIGSIIPWPNPWPQTAVVGIVLIFIGLVAGSDTLKKRTPEPPKNRSKKEGDG
jgi:hypothetical protein